MKLIKMHDYEGGLTEGKVYCVRESSPNFFDWVIDDTGNIVAQGINIQAKNYSDVVGNSADSTSNVFYNSELVQVLRDINQAINAGNGMSNGYSYDYEIKQAQERQAMAAESQAQYQEDQKFMMQRMEEFFRIMSEDMQKSRQEKIDAETQRQQEALAREIKIKKYTPEQKRVWYANNGYVSKMKVVYKKAS